MIPYQTNVSKLSGTNYQEVYKHAHDLFRRIEQKTKRKPYIRSAYFHKEKIFFDFFWTHLWRSGGNKERVRRLKYFQAALAVLQRSKNKPASKENPNKRSEILHRFAGMTKER